jgi:flagellin-specific chaperone FliS
MLLDFNAQLVIDIVSELASNIELEREQIDEAIDALECVRRTINIDNDEAVDKVDEIQDYLQYVMLAKKPVMKEIITELVAIMNNLQECSK